MKHMRRWLLAAGLWVAVTGVAAESGPRKVIDLSGEWKIKWIEGRETPNEVPPVDETWGTVTVPGLWTDKQHDSAWIVKEVEIAPEDVDKAFAFRFGSAAHLAKLFVNGQLVDRHMGALVPFRPKPAVGLFKGGKNQIVLGLSNGSALLGENQFEGKWLVRDKLFPGLIGNPYEYRPISGEKLTFQRWGVLVGLPFGGELIIAPRVFIDDIFVKTAVASRRLEAEVEVVNTTEQPVHVAVHGRTAGAQLIGPAEGKAAGTSFFFNDQLVPPGRHVVTVRGHWPEALLWSPEAPNLYHFIAELTPPKEEQLGQVEDREQVRFGFRDLRIDKARIMLNEAPLFMGGGSWIQYGQAPFSSVEEAKEKLRGIARWHNGNCIRTHHTLPDHNFCAAADELGVLVSIQDEQGGPAASPEYWENNIRHWAEFIRARRNNPSIVLWATDNEGTFTGGMPNMFAPAVPWLIRKMDVARQVDPTRLVTSSHNWDLRGHSDIFDAAYNNHGYFADFPTGGLKYKSWYFDFAGSWNRYSPIVIDEWGETLGMDITSQDFNDYSYRAGEFRYAPEMRVLWTRLYQAWGSYLGICFVRQQNTVSMLLNFGDRFSIRQPDGRLGGAPDYVFELSHKANKPIIAFPSHWHETLRSGEPMALPYLVINGANQPFDGRLIWTARTGEWAIDPDENGPWNLAKGTEKTVASGEIPIRLGAGERTEVELKGKLPTVNKSTALQIAVELRRSAPLLEDSYVPSYLAKEWWLDRVWADKRMFALSPPTNLQGLKRFAVLGHGEALSTLKRLGARFAVVASVEAGTREKQRTLVVQPGVRLSAEEWRKLEEFVEGGGKLLALSRGEDLPSGSFRGVPVENSGWEINAAYARASEHPITKGFIHQDLRHWRSAGGIPDPYLVGSGVMRRPLVGSFRILVDAGYGWEGGGGERGFSRDGVHRSISGAVGSGGQGTGDHQQHSF